MNNYAKLRTVVTNLGLAVAMLLLLSCRGNSADTASKNENKSAIQTKILTAERYVFRDQETGGHKMRVYVIKGDIPHRIEGDIVKVGSDEYGFCVEWSDCFDSGSDDGDSDWSDMCAYEDEPEEEEMIAVNGVIRLKGDSYVSEFPDGYEVEFKLLDKDQAICEVITSDGKEFKARLDCVRK